LALELIMHLLDLWKNVSG